MSDNIKVAIKVRPLIKSEKDVNSSIQWVTQENSIVSTDAEMKKRGDGRFQFDHIFDMNTKNIILFDNIVKPIVDAAVNGFNGTVFAYGQTSSGKTYTMMGTPEEDGTIPLAIQYMFDAIANTTGREFLLRVSYLEIYNEKVNDLLSQNNTDLKIHEDSNGHIFVGCKEEITNCPESVLSLMYKGNKNRRIGATNMNERSSRGHTIFRITIESREADAGSDSAIQVSQLNMVDLAGSERILQTGAIGERLIEGRHINLSLLTLTIVINQLSESQDTQKFVNFRGSKLTRLLQASLGGNALTVIICAITPAALEESYSTLSFAFRAKSIKNKPQLNEVMSDEALLKRYARQIDMLQTELDRMKQFNGPAQVQEMEFKMQEKDRINESLEERIRLLQKKLVHGDNRNNLESFKCKAKRRRTWAGTKGCRKTSSIYTPWMDLSPIKEMSPVKPRKKHIQSSNINASFQIAFADFEIELMETEENREVESDDDSFAKFHRHITFRDDVAQKSLNTCGNIDITPEKANTCVQTINQQSPGTPRIKLREKIRYLTEEYSQLQEYTTLEKQLYIEDHHCNIEEKLLSEKGEFQNKISDLENKLAELESCNIYMKNELNEQQITLQKFQQLEEEMTNLRSDKNKSEQSAFEMKDELKKAENTNISITDKLNKQQLKIQEFQDQEKRIVEQFASEKDEFKLLISGLEHKLKETITTNESMKNKIDEQQQSIDKLQHFECINSELQEKLKETESCNNIIMENLNKLEIKTQETIKSQERYIEDGILQRTKLEEIIFELQEKLKNTELDNNIMKHEINKQDLQKTCDLETEIKYITSKTNDFKNIVYKLRDELNEAVHCNSRKNEIDRQELQSQRIQELETEIIKLKSEKNECRNILTESQQLVSSPSNETSFTQVLKDSYSNDDEINRSKSHIHDLQNIQDVEREKKYFKKQALNSLDNEDDHNDNDMTKLTDLTISDDDSAKLSADLILKTQEVDEIKHDVQSLKRDIGKLQETIYLLTTENTNLQKEIAHLAKLNKKLSDLKLSTCIHCTHLKESNESRRELELEVKLLSHKLEDSQKKFDRESAKTNALISKMNEDLNLSSCNSSFNASLLENMNVSCMEEKLESLNNELQALKGDHYKLSDLYKEKCDEVEELHNNSVIELIRNNDTNSSVKKSSSKTSLRLENILKTMNELQNDFQELKENYVSIKTDLGKFTNEKESLLDEINSLKITNEELLYKSSENELSLTTALEKANILENELIDMTKNMQEFNVIYKTIENGKLLVEAEMESLKDEKITNEQMINQLRQNFSCLQHELDSIKEQKKELEDNKDYLQQEYEKRLESLNSMNKELSNSKATISQKFTNYSKESENKLIELNEKINKYTTENDYLKQELIKLHQIENKFEEIKSEYQFKCQQDNTLADDNKKLKDIINITSKNIINEIKSLKPKANTQEYLDKSIDELFQTCLQIILTKEKEIAKTLRDEHEKEKQKLQDEKRQSVDTEKRTLSWSKKLEMEIEELQGDLFERETVCDKLEKEIVHLKNLLEQSNLEGNALKERISSLEIDVGNLQTELEKYSKNDTKHEEAIIIAQQREKQAQEMIKNKEIEFQTKIKLEKETDNIRIEELTCKNELLKTKNMELVNSIEGLEVNQEQFKNIIHLKTNDLLKSNQIIQKMKTESEQFTEAFNDLNRELEEKKLRIEELLGLLKTKCDKLTEYKTNLETIVPENKLLKQQINERKTSIEQYKMEINSLKMSNEKEIDSIKDGLKFEELKGIELNKQVAELNNKNLALAEEIKILKEDYNTLQHKNAVLEKRIRNSTSKIQAEEQLEEIKDINKSLQSSLDGASNRVTELQATKTDLMKKLVILNNQYDTINKENQNLKETLLSYVKCYGANTNEIDEKYNVLLQEKNKIALELEAIKVLLNQKNEDIKNYTSKIQQLIEKNTELDREADELAETVNQRDVENVRFQDQLFSCRDEVDALKDQIKTLEEKNRNLYPQKLNKFSSKIEEVQKDKSTYTISQDKIRELQLEIASKDGKIATLELQIRSGSFPYQTKYTELQENLLTCKNTNKELRSKILNLQKTNTKECNICRQKIINKKDQTCQTMPNNLLRFCGTSSGIIDDEAKIMKLEKDKNFMKDVCRSRAKTIKELEKQIEDYEILLNSRKS